MKKDLEEYRKSKFSLENEIISLSKEVDELIQFKRLSDSHSKKLKYLFDQGIIDEVGKPL